MLFPIYVMVIGSLKPGNKLLEHPLLPTSLTLDTLREAWRDGNLGRAMCELDRGGRRSSPSPR